MVKGLVSIIIPVYKVEKYLDECVQSVVGQTYSDLEIILVDDGSPDRCPQMCDDWACRDSRIKVVHKKNQGLGMARNTGLDNANGEYVYFLDSDDYILNNAIEELYKAADRECADFVGAGEFIVGDKKSPYIGSVPKRYRVYKGKEVHDVFLPDIIAPDPVTGEQVGFTMCIANYLISMRLIDESGWRCASEREIISEDFYSFLALCRNMKCAVAVPEILSCYRYNPKSLSRSYIPGRYGRNKDFYYSCISLAENCGYSQKIKNRLSCPFLSITIAAIKQIIASNLEKKSKKRMITDIFNDETLHIAIDRYDFSGEKFNRKVLFSCMKYRLYVLAYLLLWIKADR